MTGDSCDQLCPHGVKDGTEVPWGITLGKGPSQLKEGLNQYYMARVSVYKKVRATQKAPWATQRASAWAGDPGSGERPLWMQRISHCQPSVSAPLLAHPHGVSLSAHCGQPVTLESQPTSSQVLESRQTGHSAGLSCCFRGGRARLGGDWEAAGAVPSSS